MADEQSREESDRAETPDRGGAAAVLAGRPDRTDGGFFTIYKKGHGYWTRMGTAVGALLVAALFAQFVYGRLAVAKNVYKWPLNYPVIFGIAAAVFGLLMLLAWRLMNKPTNADFLIATDSEMKKVNWTTRKELIGSTKVVIFFVLLISLLLFVLDLFFGYLFYAIKVLEVPPF